MNERFRKGMSQAETKAYSSAACADGIAVVGAREDALGLKAEDIGRALQVRSNHPHHSDGRNGGGNADGPIR